MRTIHYLIVITSLLSLVGGGANMGVATDDAISQLEHSKGG